MSWTPTEGQKRADAVMREMRDSAQSLGIAMASSEYPMHHHRVFTLIAAALDQALADGAERDVLDKVVGNGHAPVDELPAGTVLHFHQNAPPAGWQLEAIHSGANGSGFIVCRKLGPEEPAARFEQHLTTYQNAPIGFDRERTDDDVYVARAMSQEEAEAILAHGTFAPMREEEAKPKKRGRPKGAKGKKKAKAQKAAKVVVENGAAEHVSEPIAAPEVTAEAAP